jgi:hypothetical protein
VHERAERADDEVDRLVEREIADVALAQLDREPGCAFASIAGGRSMPMTRLPVSRAIGIATRPVPTASSTIGSVASRASDTYHCTSSTMSAAQMS